MSPRSIGSAAWRISSLLRRDRPFSASGGSTSRARRRESSSRARWASARALSSAACRDGSAAFRASSCCRSDRARASRAAARPPRPRPGAGRREVGGLADQAVDLVAYGVLPGLEPVELRPVAGGLGLVGDPLLASGQSLEPPALRVILVPFVQLALELLQAIADGAEPVGRLLEIGEATLRVIVLPGAVEHRSAALGLELGDLTRGPGERPESRVLVEIAGETQDAVDQRAGVRLAALDGLLAGPVPSTFTALGRFGGIAKPFGLLPIGRRGLLQGVEHRLATPCAGVGSTGPASARRRRRS